MQLSEKPKRLSLVRGTEPSQPNELARLTTELPLRSFTLRGAKDGEATEEGGGILATTIPRGTFGSLSKALEEAQLLLLLLQQCKQASPFVRSSLTGRFHLPLEMSPNVVLRTRSLMMLQPVVVVGEDLVACCRPGR